jgi:hypothetical protein
MLRRQFILQFGSFLAAPPVIRWWKFPNGISQDSLDLQLLKPASIYQTHVDYTFPESTTYHMPLICDDRLVKELLPTLVQNRYYQAITQFSRTGESILLLKHEPSGIGGNVFRCISVTNDSSPDAANPAEGELPHYLNNLNASPVPYDFEYVLDLLHKRPERMIFIDMPFSFHELWDLHALVNTTGKTIVLTQFGTYSNGVRTPVFSQGRPGNRLYYGHWGFEYLERRKYQQNYLNLLLNERLLRQSMLESVVCFSFDGRTNEAGFPKCSTQIFHPAGIAPPDLIMESFKQCTEHMRPGVIYFTRIRLLERIKWNPGQPRNWNAIHVCSKVVYSALEHLMRRFGILEKLRQHISCDDLTSSSPIEVGKKLLHIGFVDIEDSTSERIFRTTSKSPIPIYSTSNIWTWTALPGEIPDPEKHTTGWLAKCGYLEWTVEMNGELSVEEPLRLYQPMDS